MSVSDFGIPLLCCLWSIH